ncbi:TPA: hypothetical protein HIT98_004707 [Escherichia coli]|uniref:hypothetical protein n=1 Tax=Escherichia TaxID=561 RepID=UPI000CF79479|nr:MULTISPECIES: hypothetical protein [Escherichia]EES2025997.1 hypothetical protein [Escherichia coli]EFB2841232.1 hypothetical protein [Escherichia coli]EFH7156810.1 hypothetical protein [Escherichia coli]EFS7177997.1 hypothetical protein [Escherichia coli]EGF1626225.1 hypothetical protein [Escherichia coli]
MNKPLVNFAELSGDAINYARQSVIEMETASAREKIGKARLLFRSGIHCAVNGYPLIQSAANHLIVIKRLQADTKYLDACIAENLCMFSTEGFLYLFMQRRFINEPVV